MEKKRDRCVNFQQQEVDMLVNLVEKRKEVLENKKSDSVTWKNKDDEWKRLEDEFNSLSSCNNYRSAKHLRTKYECMKRSIRKKSAEIRSQTYQTGGGSNTAPPLTAVESKVKNMILLSVDGLESKFDSDVIPTLDEDITEIFQPEVVLLQSTVQLPFPSDTPLMTPVPINEVVYTNDVPERPVLGISPDIATSNTQTPHVSKSDHWDGWKPAKLRTRKHNALQGSKTFEKLSEVKLETALLQKRLIMEELKDKEIERERKRRKFEETEKEWACNEFIRKQKRKFATKLENLKWL